MDLEELKKELTERRKRSQTYQDLSEEFEISKPALWRIIQGKRPGKKICAILKIEFIPVVMTPIPVCPKCGHPHTPRKSCSAPTPSRALLTTRARNARLNEIAQSWGFPSASTILTEILAGKIVGVILRKDGE